jgi:hypothetical protein
VRNPVSDEVNRPQNEPGNAGQGLLERAFARENLKRAWKRVKANKGVAGVDGLDIEQTAKHLLSRWPTICEQLISGAYTRRSCGRSLQLIVDDLRPYILGWKAYFGLSQTPAVWRELNEWIRHRLRATQLKQWKRGTTTYRELRALGASNQVAQKVAGNTCRWWHNSRLELNRVLTIAWFDRLGLVRLS